MNKILELAPHLQSSLLRYFIDIAFADGELNEEELKLIYDFGDKIGFGQFEIAKAIVMKIQSDFEPKASGLKL